MPSEPPQSPPKWYKSPLKELLQRGKPAPSPFKLQAKPFRTFTSLSPLRPTLFPSTYSPSLAMSKPITSTVASESGALDLLPKISAHPAIGMTQVRCGPRNTFSPSHFVRKRRHGFLSRLRTRKGRATLQRRKSKRRNTLSH